MKSNIKWIIFFTCLCLVCIVMWIIRGHISDKSITAIIKQGNTVIRTINLSSLSEPYEFKISDGHGGHNTIRAERGRIAVIESDCPNQICVSQGYIESSAAPIVCLPHNLSVSIISGNSDVDALSGGK